MKISKIEVENFRLLKDFRLDLEEELSLVVGKNNTGKTSILTILSRFLNPSEKNKFTFDDFNIEYRQHLFEIVESENLYECYMGTGIKLRLFIEYTETCNLENISKVMMDLDPENNSVVLEFEYVLSAENLAKLRSDWSVYKDENQDEQNDRIEKLFFEFFSEKYTKYFTRMRKSVVIDKDGKVDETTFIDLDKEHIVLDDIIRFRYISARREVDNKDRDKTLSTLTSRIYDRIEPDEKNEDAQNDFKSKLKEADKKFNEVYEKLFEEIVSKVKCFGGSEKEKTEIEITSSLKAGELIKGNTTVVYKHDESNKLPESYNGLGYLNLISLIFEIEIQMQEFRRKNDEKPADINLLFIEEPEAHTHPQMQYIFIKNIKALLREGIKRIDGNNKSLQYIISTHSSHIVADSDFEDIKYLKRDGQDSVIAKNLKDLKKEYSDPIQSYQFLTQYLTLSRAEVFFADKAILIEGDTERILIHAMMQKIDMNKETTIGPNGGLPLLSQNISTIEVGAYSHIFDNFISFLGIKTLIITDLDTTTADGNKCRVADGVNTSNGAIKYYLGKVSLNDLKAYTLEDKILSKTDNGWVKSEEGNLCIVYETEEDGYHARSFEDAFIHINRKTICEQKEHFLGLKNKDYFSDENRNAYDLAENCIGRKTYFAMDILYHSDKNMSNWSIPNYIKEGLLWLKKD